MLDRESALTLLAESGIDDTMLRHCLFSEKVLRALAHNSGEDEEVWGMAGLLHDVDYSHTKETPERHGAMAVEMLAGKFPQHVLDAIKAHNSEYTGQDPNTNLDYALRAGESVTGLVHAASLLRPTGMQGMGVKSLKKKMNDKSFAASVNREHIRECEKIGLPLDDFLAIAIKAMTL